MILGPDGKVLPQYDTENLEKNVLEKMAPQLLTARIKARYGLSLTPTEQALYDAWLELIGDKPVEKVKPVRERHQSTREMRRRMNNGRNQG